MNIANLKNKKMELAAILAGGLIWAGTGFAYDNNAIQEKTDKMLKETPRIEFIEQNAQEKILGIPQYNNFDWHVLKDAKEEVEKKGIDLENTKLEERLLNMRFNLEYEKMGQRYQNLDKTHETINGMADKLTEKEHYLDQRIADLEPFYEEFAAQVKNKDVNKKTTLKENALFLKGLGETLNYVVLGVIQDGVKDHIEKAGIMGEGFNMLKNAYTKMAVANLLTGRMPPEDKLHELYDATEKHLENANKAIDTYNKFFLNAKHLNAKQ